MDITMDEHRNYPRYDAITRVKIEGIDSEEIFLKDLSITGCRIECDNSVEMEMDKQYSLEIYPAGEARIKAFDFTAESKWIRAFKHTKEIGFIITKSPEGKKFQRYVDYLTWRSSWNFDHDK